MPSAEIVIVGAGIGGLAAALRLSAEGHEVALFEAALAPGGKMRQVPSVAGPIDAGPTVLTMRRVFDELFELSGANLASYVELVEDPVIARHFWGDGTSLDLHADRDRNIAAIRQFAGAGEAEAFIAFAEGARRLFEAFEGPVMRKGSPSHAGILAAVMRRPGILRDMLPGKTLFGSLASHFEDTRLRQLFGRYATYVGGSPLRSPAMNALIWEAEAQGVWGVRGGMHALARGIASLAERHGASLNYGQPVAQLLCKDSRATGVALEGGEVVNAEAVLFNGDPAAIRSGMLGEAVSGILPRGAVEPRAHSAVVWTFAAEGAGVQLSHHNVFFGDDPASEFEDLASGRLPEDPTLYVCAQDRVGCHLGSGVERFQIIMNAPPLGLADGKTEEGECRTRVFKRLSAMGLEFDPLPDLTAATRPADFATLFPGSGGSLYGRSPHGLTAALARPTARTRMQGLYLAGGGVHPGPGMPMAALSGRHAAEAIMQDLASTWRSRRTATHGGMSTGSRTTTAAQSRS